MGSGHEDENEDEGLFLRCLWNSGITFLCGGLLNFLVFYELSRTVGIPMRSSLP